MNKKNEKKSKLKTDLLKDQNDLEKTLLTLKSINTKIKEHYRKLDKDVNELISEKDKALQQVAKYNRKIEDLMVKFAEEKENLTDSLTDKLSKHKIAKIADEIGNINNEKDISSIKSSV